MTRKTSARIRPGACAAGALALLLAYAGSAHAVDENVKQYCADDYLAYCSQHAPDGADVRYCMEAHRKELSKQCVGALVDAGQVPKKYLTRKVVDRE